MNQVTAALDGLREATGSVGQNLRDLLSNTVEDTPDLIPGNSMINTLGLHNQKVVVVGLLSFLIPFLAFQLLCWCCSSPKEVNCVKLTKSRSYLFGERFDRSSTESKPKTTILDAVYEAKRWFRQAEHDLDAARHDMDQTDPSYEWACFKCH